MRIAGFAAAITIPIIAITGCSKSAMSVDEIESTVASELNKSYTDIGKKVVGVRCPEEMAKSENGKGYVCTVDLEGNPVRVSVTMQDGQVSQITALDAVYDLAKLSKIKTDEQSQKVGHPVTVNCGTGIKVVPAGERFPCEYVDGDMKSTLDMTATIQSSSSSASPTPTK